MERRNVTTRGIRFMGKMYWNDLLKEHMGEQVHVLELDDKGFIDVYKGNTCICRASRVTSSSKRLNDKGGHGKDMLGFGKKLQDYKSEELIKELQSRKNVSILKMNKNQQYQVKNAVKRIKERGPATVLVIRNA